jgi:transposase
MDRAGLEQCDRTALIEIILRQQQMIERLAAEVAELKAEVGRPRKTPENSSVPPSRGQKANRAAEPGRGATGVRAGALHGDVGAPNLSEPVQQRQ